MAIHNLTIEEITNLFLYGTDTTPSNLKDESLIRPEDVVTKTTVDQEAFMTDGAGRFAIGALFDLVQLFFSATTDPSALPPPDSNLTAIYDPDGLGKKVYTKEQLAIHQRLLMEFFGLRSFGCALACSCVLSAPRHARALAGKPHDALAEESAAALAEFRNVAEVISCLSFTIGEQAVPMIGSIATRRRIR